MKHILLGTSALVGAALIAGAALAEDPKVMVGGVIDFQAGYVAGDADGASSNVGFRNDTEINVSVEGKSDAGLGYGAVVDLEADVSGDTDGQGFNASRTYTFLDGSFGRIEMGSVEGAAQTMQVDAATVARATGGINGDWYKFLASASTLGTAAAPLAISNSSNPAYHGFSQLGGDDFRDNAAKITYYSPRFSGFQFGGSYTPNSDSRGSIVDRADAVNAWQNIFDLGLGYEGQFGGIGVKVAGTYEFSSDDNGTLFAAPRVGGSESLNAWNVGAVVTAWGINFAGSYGDWNDSLGSATDSNYYTLGAAYDFGPFGASVTWLDSTVEDAAGDNDFQNLVLGADYALAPGLTPYVEVSFFDYDSTVAADSNDGTVAIVGTQLAF